MTDHPDTIGLGPLRSAPAGLPEPSIAPPVLAESADPFALLRVVCLVARLPRGRPLRLADVTARLNALHLDWLFAERVVADAVVQLAANWGADFRTTAGLVLAEGPSGPTVTIEDSPRVDPWIVRQAERAAERCREELLAFSRRERPAGDG